MLGGLWPIKFTFSIIFVSAANRSIGSATGCTIMEKASTRAFSWLKASTTFHILETKLGAFSVIVQPVVEPMDRFTALVISLVCNRVNAVLMAVCFQ